MIERLNGYKVFLFSFLTGTLAILEQLGAIDLLPLLTFVGLSQPSASAIVIMMATASALLRLVTTTPPGRRRK